MEVENEPGTARHGNFINYYSFNPPERRTKLISSQLLQDLKLWPEKIPVVALDIGCNAGDLTTALYEHLTGTKPTIDKPSEDQSESEEDDDEVDENTPLQDKSDLDESHAHMLNILGIDIDPDLIKRCIASNKHIAQLTFEVGDIMDPTDQLEVVEAYIQKYDQRVFDVTFCFSVTMWIHLHHGDKGLKQFLQYIAKRTRFLVIEPQPWKCYKNAMRRMKKLGCESFPHFPTLEWRGNVDIEIQDFLAFSCEMESVKSLGQTQQWDRNVCLFQRKNMIA